MKSLKIILVGLFSIGLLTGCGCTKKEEPKKEKKDISTNVHEDVIKDQEVENFKFEKTSLIYKDGNSRLETMVTNTSAEEQFLSEFWIHVYGEDGNEIIKFVGFVGSKMAPGENKIITSTYGADLTNAVKIEYEVKR